MRALFLIPGDAESQLQAVPAVAATAEQLGFAIQVVCPPAQAPLWKLIPAVEKLIPFPFGEASLADWANLLGCVREPDFQLAVNLAPSPRLDLTLSMSHIPVRVASGGFSATTTVPAPAAGWPPQALDAHLAAVGVRLDADAFRLAIKPAALAEAAASLPGGEGPLLLLAPRADAADWPESLWQQLPERIRAGLPSLRWRQVPPATPASVVRRAAEVAASDVVLASDPLTIALALYCGTPLVALGCGSANLPVRQEVRAVGEPGQLSGLGLDTVLQALGLG